MKQMVGSDYQRMLKDIGVVCFAVVELTLYLDTHPYDKQAMEYLNHYSCIEKQLKQDFAMKYYPLNVTHSQDTKEWSWALAPMPWEGGC